MDRAPIEALTGTKACADCAHFMPDRHECGAHPSANFVTGLAGYMSVDAARIWKCGTEQALHFTPSDKAQAARSVRRLQLAKAIEDGITRLRPDPAMAAESIVDALSVALKARYDERLPDVQDLLTQLASALREADDISDGSPA